MRLATLALNLGFLVTSFALGVASGRQQNAQVPRVLDRQPVAGSTPDATLPALTDGAVSDGTGAAPGVVTAVAGAKHGATSTRIAREELSFSQIAARAQQWTAAVRADQNYGAGIILDRAGLVLTNQHVVDGTHSITVTPFGGDASVAEVLDSDAQLDLALLRLPDGLAELQPASTETRAGSMPQGNGSTDGSAASPAASRDLPSLAQGAGAVGPSVRAGGAVRGSGLPRRAALGSSAPLVVGDEVLAVGSPRKMYFSVSRGMVSFPNRFLDGIEYIQTDLPINVGNSGGPLVDRQGRIVGVVSFILRDSQGISFALPIERAVTRFAKYLEERDAPRPRPNAQAPARATDPAR